MIPAGLCQCGCGGETAVAEKTNARRGWVKGQPKRFLHGHYVTTDEIRKKRQRYQRLPNRLEMRDGEMTLVVSIGDHGRLAEMLCSPEDEALADSCSWVLRKDGYARTVQRGAALYFHSLVMREALDRARESGWRRPEVDHVNNNKLDNRRSNLRLATRRQNMANRARATKNRQGNPLQSVYRGVVRSGNAWTVMMAGKHVGSFADEREAALAWDKEARLAYGEFARLNFPEVTE